MLDTLSARKLVFKTLYSLPDARQANASQWTFVLLFELDGEVRNGGFNQYFYNTSADLAKVEAAFEELGDEALTAVVREALTCFRNHRQEIEARWGDSLKSFAASYRNNPLGEWDTAYYEVRGKNSRFYALLAAFVRQHAADFVTEG